VSGSQELFDIARDKVVELEKLKAEKIQAIVDGEKIELVLKLVDEEGSEPVPTKIILSLGASKLLRVTKNVLGIGGPAESGKSTFSSQLLKSINEHLKRFHAEHVRTELLEGDASTPDVHRKLAGDYEHVSEEKTKKWTLQDAIEILSKVLQVEADIAVVNLPGGGRSPLKLTDVPSLKENEIMQPLITSVEKLVIINRRKSDEIWQKQDKEWKRLAKTGDVKIISQIRSRKEYERSRMGGITESEITSISPIALEGTDAILLARIGGRIRRLEGNNPNKKFYDMYVPMLLLGLLPALALEHIDKQIEYYKNLCIEYKPTVLQLTGEISTTSRLQTNR